MTHVGTGSKADDDYQAHDQKTLVPGMESSGQARGSLISAEIRSRLNRVETTVLGEVTARDIERYAAIVGDENPLYRSGASADETKSGAIAPPNMLTAMIGWGVGPSEDCLNADGTPMEHETGLDLSSLKRAMGAGQELEFHGLVRAGDTFRRVSRIIEIAERAGKKGPFVLIRTLEQYINQRDEIVVDCTKSTILR